MLKWSPDSTKIATFQHDGLGVGEMYLVSTEVGHPRLEAWKYPLPGDAKIFMLYLWSSIWTGLEWCGCKCRQTPIARPPPTTSQAAAASS